MISYRCNAYLLLIVISLGILSCQEEQATNSAGDPILDDFESPARKVGFMNIAAEVIVPPQFDEVRPASQGRIAVNKGGVWGFISLKGKEITPPQYLGAWSFSEGLARVQEPLSRSYGYVDLKGELFIPCIYESATDMNDGKAVVSKDRYYGILSITGKEIVPCSYDDIKILSHTFYAVQDATDWFIQSFVDKDLRIGPFQNIDDACEEYFVVSDTVSSFLYYHNQRYHAVDSLGRLLLHCRQQQLIRCPSNDSCQLMTFEGTPISKVYSNIRYMGEDRYAIKKGNKWAVMDTEGDVVSPFAFDLLYHYSDGFAPYLDGKLWGFIDRHGRRATPPIYGLAWPFSDQMARVLTRQGIAMIDTNYQIRIPPGNGDLRDMKEGLVAFRK